LAGAWQNFLYANVWILIPHAQLDTITSGLRRLLLWRSIVGLASAFPSAAAAAVLGLTAALLARTRLALAAVSWLIASLAGVYLRGRFSEPHYLPVLPPLALLGGIGFGWWLRLRPTDGLAVQVARVAATAAVLGWGIGIACVVVSENRGLFAKRWAEVL